MRAGYRVVADGGNGLTDLAGVDNFSGPRRCSGKGCAGGGTTWARSTRRPDVPHDNALRDAAMEAPAPRRRLRRPRQGRKGVRTRDRVVRVVTTQTTRRSLAPVAARARAPAARQQQQHQQPQYSQPSIQHRARNRPTHAAGRRCGRVVVAAAVVAAPGGLARRPQRMPHSPTPQQVVRRFIGSA
jgi:hypothetical protein